MVKSIPESTRERAREYLGCPGGEGGSETTIWYMHGESGRLLKVPGKWEHDDPAKNVYAPELIEAVRSGKHVLVQLVEGEDGSYYDGASVYTIGAYEYFNNGGPAFVKLNGWDGNTVRTCEQQQAS